MRTVLQSSNGTFLGSNFFPSLSLAWLRRQRARYKVAAAAAAADLSRLTVILVLTGVTSSSSSAAAPAAAAATAEDGALVGQASERAGGRADGRADGRHGSGTVFTNLADTRRRNNVKRKNSSRFMLFHLHLYITFVAVVS
jgi:hypothetical protein